MPDEHRDTSPRPPLRPPAFVMSPDRAATAVPTALGFARAAMRRIVRERYVIEKLRFDLDDEGRGELLYRLVGEGWTFHFFLISQKLPEAVKTDRNFAQSWDAMGVLCQGEWTPDREALLRREVPKQRAGFADYDTLIYARGNRSARLFDHVVESLAAGRQPDAEVLAPVGYILRTTAFIGNGQLGTRPLEGYEPDHPFRRPYHAQFASAFVLREYVFDLVDHLARCRSPDAVALAPEFRRYLGLGNAAATGLVPFIVNHPHLMHAWTSAGERALAEAKRRPVQRGDAHWRRFTALLDKAIRYSREGTRPDDGVFAPARTLVDDLERLRRRVAHADAVTSSWLALTDWAHGHLKPEACETLDAIVLELYPDIVDAASDLACTDERFVLDPAMGVAEMSALVREQYGWALGGRASDDAQPHFWYRTTKTPRDVRRGLRGRVADLEFENAIDTVREVRRLAGALEATEPSVAIGDLVGRRQDLRHIATRVQSLAGLPYSELRADWLAPDFSPFGPVRFVLSHFGLEKFEAAMPKSVRGTFMQGAPIAEDVVAGRDGDWPFPLMPKPSGATTTRAVNTEPHSVFTIVAAPDPAPDDALRIAPRELARMVQNALQGHGAALGVAEFAADLAAAAQVDEEAACDVVLRDCREGHVRQVAGLRIEPRGRSLVAIDAHRGCALVAAADALDQAQLRAQTTGRGSGVTLASGARNATLLAALALRAAGRGCIGLLVWNDAASGTAAHGFAIAAPDPAGVWFARGSLRAPAMLLAALQRGVQPLEDAAESSLTDEILAALASTPATSTPATPVDAFAIACFTSASTALSQRLFAKLRSLRDGGSVFASIRVADAAEVSERESAARRGGVSLRRRQFDALAKAGEALLVPVDEEHRVLREGADPLKVF